MDRDSGAGGGDDADLVGAEAVADDDLWSGHSGRDRRDKLLGLRAIWSSASAMCGKSSDSASTARNRPECAVPTIGLVSAAGVRWDRIMAIVVRAELAVPAAKRAEFVEVALALAAAAADEPGTLRYDWYESTDPAADPPADSALFVVIEEYADPAAAVAHNQHSAGLLGRAGQLAEMTSAQLHGDLGPELEAWAAKRSFASTYRPLGQA